jgi:hypothetical protein
MAQEEQVVARWPYVETVLTRPSGKIYSGIYITGGMKFRHKIFQFKMRLHWYSYVTCIKKCMFCKFFLLILYQLLTLFGVR